MVQLMRLALALALALGLGAPALAHAQSPCQDGALDGQLIRICIPPRWNGQLVVYAHGYVAPQQSLALPIGELTIDGQFVPDMLLSLGFAFATSSYSKNGYALEQAEHDLNALVDHFNQVAPRAAHKVFIIGASEGGIITTMLVERFPEKYTGGLALCGPIGGVPHQIKYLGDFRVVFDYFFPDVFPFGAVDVPPTAFRNWGTFVQAITGAIRSNPDAANQLFNVTRAARDPHDPAASAVTTAVSVLFYSIFGTNDLLATADGNPYDNRFTRYRGSANDAALNAGVERVQSDATARAYVRTFYDTTGQLQRPLVTLHTTLDPVVPFRHELIYTGKVLLAGRSHNLITLPVPRYGHCNFTIDEVLGAFALLLLRSTGESLTATFFID
jgi:pimeloyl-ACP methyl ester carboxylesterase